MRMFGAAAEIASSFLMEGKHSFYGVVEWLGAGYVWARSRFILSLKVANSTPPRFENSIRLSVSSWLGSQARVNVISSISFAVILPLL